MGVVTMGPRELHVRWSFLVGSLMFASVMGGGLEEDKNSDEVIEQGIKAVSDVIMDMSEDSDVLRDISELRREVEQLRSEVRQKREKAPLDNTEMIVDWLKDTVGDLREEVRNLEIKEERREVGVKEDEVERVRREVRDVKKDILKLRVVEERSLSRMDEIGQRLDHVAKGEEMALRRINRVKTSGLRQAHEKKSGKYNSHGKSGKHHKNLSKKHLQMWMVETDNKHQELLSMVKDNKGQLSKMETKQEDRKYQYCQEMKKKVDEIDKTIEEQRDIMDRRDEADKIIFSLMTAKIEQIEHKFEKAQLEQALTSRRIESLSNDLILALRNIK